MKILSMKAAVAGLVWCALLAPRRRGRRKRR